MCGIAGVLSSGRVDPLAMQRMVATLRHRGPDDEGIWLDPETGIALGHRRLSVIDLSANGHQPMVSQSGRYVLTCNGEIYNHVALRAALESEGIRGWRGHSDTETLLEAIASWGLTAVLRKCVGMFALALWDRQARKLFLARDRFGEKPLYYGRAGKDFLFASELKAIRAHPDFSGTIDRDSLRIFAARGYIPAPRSIFREISKLEPGTILAVDGGAETGRPTFERYWSYRNVVESGLANPLPDEEAARRELESALIAAIQGQSVADVPVGVFLSGGIDSSTITALWREHSSRELRTYSMGFEESGFDEAPHARAVARHLGTVHHESYVTSAEARDVIPLLPAIYDEPFADPSQIPTWLMSKLARASVTVALSGDGGDELFGGYSRYPTAANLWQKMRRVPPSVRHAAGAVLGKLPSGIWDRLAANRAPFPGTRLQRTFHRFEGVDSFAELYRSFRDEWTGEPSPAIGATSDDSTSELDLEVADGSDLVRMMYCDTMSYLPGDILCKVDRAAMAHGLEVRIPFLDHRVADVAARIPIGMKVRNGKGKYILKRLLSSHVPSHLFERPKAGFSVPIGAWLKGPLRPWAEEMLSRDRLDREGFFSGAMIQRRWQDHLAGRRDATHSLWPILMFQAWKQN
ncbi:MAG: asparagine synthase (glutamine-hydrolyzing) [Verrucomicrobiaceae bacterium]|nr:asparagine synthase (glutamine-hydrolyzing) [Verrucomicrobiaceae bacterium]